jgi:Putative DNA-binding domain
MSADTFAGSLLRPDSPLPAGLKGHVPRRFAVYRNNVVTGLVRAMEANFPAVRRLLGDTYFAGLSREYVRSNPPHSPLMFEYGDSFPGFMAKQPDLVDYPYLHDVAHLEIMMREAHHAADTEILKPEFLARVSPERVGEVTFEPHPALYILASGFSAASIFKANCGDGLAQVSNPGLEEWAVVTRPNLDVILTSISSPQFTFVENLGAGKCLSEATELACDVNVDFDLASTLLLLLNLGAFSSINL